MKFLLRLWVIFAIASVANAGELVSSTFIPTSPPYPIYGYPYFGYYPPFGCGCYSNPYFSIGPAPYIPANQVIGRPIHGQYTTDPPTVRYANGVEQWLFKNNQYIPPFDYDRPHLYAR